MDSITNEKFKSNGTPVGTHTNFAISGSNKTFSWAKARIEGNKVIVWNDAISNPVAVRYAWGQNPAGKNYSILRIYQPHHSGQIRGQLVSSSF